LMQPASKKQARPAVGNVVADVNGKKVTWSLLHFVKAFVVSITFSE
jgi:hypothetical protein